MAFPSAGDKDVRLVPWTFDAGYVLERTLPTSAELAYGVAQGWVSGEAAVAIALAKYEAGAPLRPEEERLALLLSDQFDQITDIVSALQVDDQPTERRARLWLYLALAWLREHRADVDDPLQVIELLYADFDHTPEIRHFVRFMPPTPGQPMGVRAIEQAWHTWVERTGDEYRERLHGRW